MTNKLFKAIEKIGDYNRKQKYKMFCQLFKPNANTKILDLGASEWEYRRGANILEKRYEYTENITVLGVEEYDEFCKRYPKIKTVRYKGGTFPFKEKAFDICWCNAVIEHVGDRNEQELFLKEISRVASHAFVTTPNKYFIYEPHTGLIMLHYLPKKIFDKILIIIGEAWAAGNYMHLLGKKDIIKLLKKCNISKYKIIRTKMLGFTTGFVIKF